MYETVGGKVSSDAYSLSRSPGIRDISETSKRQTSIAPPATGSWIVCDSLHTSLVRGTQKVYKISKCNWKNFKRRKKTHKNLFLSLKTTCRFRKYVLTSLPGRKMSQRTSTVSCPCIILWSVVAVRDRVYQNWRAFALTSCCYSFLDFEQFLILMIALFAQC